MLAILLAIFPFSGIVQKHEITWGMCTVTTSLPRHLTLGKRLGQFRNASLSRLRPLEG